MQRTIKFGFLISQFSKCGVKNMIAKQIIDCCIADICYAVKIICTSFESVTDLGLLYFQKQMLSNIGCIYFHFMIAHNRY